MNSGRVLLSLLVVASALVDAAVFFGPPSPARSAALLGLAFGQAALVAVWLTAGSWSVGFRFYVALGLVVSWAVVLSDATRPDFGQCFSALALCVAGVSAVRLSVRGSIAAWGAWSRSMPVLWSAGFSPLGPGDDGSRSVHRPPQYSLAALLGLMAFVAGACAASTWMNWTWLVMRGPATSCGAFLTLGLLTTSSIGLSRRTCLPVASALAAGLIVAVGLTYAEGTTLAAGLGRPLFVEAAYLGCGAAVIRIAEP